MIKINRTGIRPVILYKTGANAGQDKCVVKTNDLKALYSANPINYNSGSLSFSFDGELYKDASFIKILRDSQKNKCCYCQNDLDPGEVEHFRPKGYYQQKRYGKVYHPGYYWLAYEWSNLLFACGGCNGSFKGNIFPLYNQGARAKNHNDNYLLERPVLLNPLFDEPSTYIYFKKEKIKHKGPLKRGYRTIEILGLDRSALNNQRREYLNDLLSIKQSLSMSKGSSKEAQARSLWAKKISEKKRKHSRFSAMVNDNFPSTYL